MLASPLSALQQRQSLTYSNHRKRQVSEVQRVKLADADIADTIAITEGEDGKTALVEYTITYKNISTFAKLVNMDFQVPKKHAVYLSLYNGLWQVVKKIDGNYIK